MAMQRGVSDPNNEVRSTVTNERGRLVVLTGASGSGKTTIAKAFSVKHPGLAEAFHFDRGGVPRIGVMREKFGSEENWQRAKTLEALSQIAPKLRKGQRKIFDCQSRFSCLLKGLASQGISDCRLILIDCDDETRTRRLVEDRGQPDLANSRMMNWAAYLRNEAQEHGFEIMDTSRMPIDKSVARLVGCFE